MKEINLDLSLIIACFNEEGLLRQSVEEILDVLNYTRFSYEIIFIDDCSTDKTVGIIKQLVNEHPDKMKMILHKKNEGRGKTVTDGIKYSKAKIVGYIDIDLQNPARYIPSLVREVAKGADIATASRTYRLTWVAVPRWIISKGYKFLVKLFLRLNLEDTETGCKFFNRESILPVLDEVRDNHWFWDTEIMARSYLKGLKIVEIPSIFIRKGLYTRVKIFRDCYRQFIKLIEFRMQLGRIKKSEF